MRSIVGVLIYTLFTHSLLFAEVKTQQGTEEVSSAVIFMYHRFGDDRYPSTNIRLEQFEQHLEYIEKNDFNVWPLSTIVRHIIAGKKLPKKTIALTIDDAYITAYTQAYPMLKARKFPFTVFVSTNAVDIKSKNYMNWEQMNEMNHNGAEFANHSLTHAYLLQQNFQTKQAWKSRVKKEIKGAQKKLQLELGVMTNENPKMLSYPFGEYDKDVMELLQELNYVGITQTSGVLSSDTDLGAIPRFAMAEAYANIDDFILKINTLPLPVESVSPSNTIVTSNNPPLLKLKLKRVIENIKCYTANGERIKEKWISNLELEIQAKNPLEPPRDRYTCTAPARGNRWYWHSKLWIIK